MNNYYLYIEDTRSHESYTFTVYARDFDHAKKLGHSIAEEVHQTYWRDNFDIIYYNILSVNLEDD